VEKVTTAGQLLSVDAIPAGEIPILISEFLF